jgi:peptidyl-prolyl cis-trans isomerase SurA
MPRTLPILLGALAAWLLAGPVAATEQLVDAIAAQVGTRIVLVSEVMRSVGPQEAKIREMGGGDKDIAILRAEALERLIEARLIEGVVAQLELYAEESEIDGTVASIASENGLTLEQLYASVVFHGLTRDEYRQQIKRDLERRNVVNAMVGSEVTVEDLDLRLLYDEKFGNMPAQAKMVRVRQILVTYGAASKRDPDQACDVAREARKRVQAGEDFAEVAKEVSEVARRDGGDIGWLEVDQLAAWMSETLAPLSDGDVSEPILLPFGCSVLKLEETRDVTRVSFEEAKPRLQEEVWSREMDKAYRVWMEELRGRTYIDRRGYFADAANLGDTTFPIAAPPTEPEAPAAP